jgi:hypothetical protein
VTDHKLTDPERSAAYHLGQQLVRHVDRTELTVMRRDADQLATTSAAGHGWTFLTEALALAWASAQSSADRAAGAPAIESTGLDVPCDRPAVHRVDGYTRDGTSRYGSLDCVIDACGAHAMQYRDQLVAEFGTGHINVPRPPRPGDTCGSVHDLRTLRADICQAGRAPQGTDQAPTITGEGEPS